METNDRIAKPVLKGSPPRVEDVAGLRVREFELLLAIHAHRSVTAAARELGLTQPAASRTLEDIEQMLRVHLFERDRANGMQLTGAGELVIARSRELVADLRAMTSELAAYKAGSGGHLRLGLIPLVPGVLIEQLVKILVGPAHHMTVSISEGPTSQLLGELQLQRLDALIGRSSSERTGAGLTRETLMQQDACLLAHLQNARVRKRGFGLADLEGATWLLPPKGTPTRTTINECFAAAGLEPPLATVEASSSKVIHHVLAAHPDMLSIVPSEIGHDVERLGRVRRHAFPVPLRMPAVGLVFATRHRDTPVVRNLRNAVRTAIRDCGYSTPAGPVAARSEVRRRATGRDALRARGQP
jgi:DNA-binding transcriptional LysR family regulator